MADYLLPTTTWIIFKKNVKAKDTEMFVNLPANFCFQRDCL